MINEHPTQKYLRFIIYLSPHPQIQARRAPQKLSIIIVYCQPLAKYTTKPTVPLLVVVFLMTFVAAMFLAECFYYNLFCVSVYDVHSATPVGLKYEGYIFGIYSICGISVAVHLIIFAGLKSSPIISSSERVYFMI